MSVFSLILTRIALLFNIIAFPYLLLLPSPAYPFPQYISPHFRSINLPVRHVKKSPSSCQ